MRSEKAFFSFTEVPVPDDHRAYNEWHQLDHRPENLDLRGVRWGERWVSTPRCAAATVAITELSACHYVNLYWFRPPYDEAISEWQALAERSFQWGRRADVAIANRLMMGFFSTVAGYASPRVLVSPDALVFRPNRGIHLRVTRLAEPHSVRTEALARWYDRELVPEMLGVEGVAGAWTFASDSTTLDPSWQAVPGSTTFEASGRDRGAFRVLVSYLDAEPVSVASAIAAHPVWDSRDPLLTAAEEVVFAGPLEAISPWEWSWFDRELAPS